MNNAQGYISLVKETLDNLNQQSIAALAEAF